jgi:hypothetical protein
MGSFGWQRANFSGTGQKSTSSADDRMSPECSPVRSWELQVGRVPRRRDLILNSMSPRGAVGTDRQFDPMIP